MKRFFGRKKEDKILIEGQEYNHLKKVLRLSEGDNIIANINDDYDYFCTIDKMNKNDCTAIIDRVEYCQALPKKNITLFQMLPKKEYFDNIIAKSIELGVNKIVPFTSKYTMVKEIKRERVNTQIITACKQCERSKLVEISDPVKFKDLPAMLKDFEVIIFAYEREITPINTKLLEKIQEKDNIAVIIGNEGGFAEDEAEILKEISTTISLGKRILRCDTAVTATLALISILTNN